jgi:hypothetical protein
MDFAIGGLLPWSDAQGYYYDVRRLLDGYPMEWSARRPLFPAFSRCCSRHGSLYVALAVMVALECDRHVSPCTRSRVSFGSAAATVAMLDPVYAFTARRRSLAWALTENLGFLLGTVGFTALLRAVRLQDIRSYAPARGAHCGVDGEGRRFSCAAGPRSPVVSYPFGQSTGKTPEHMVGAGRDVRDRDRSDDVMLVGQDRVRIPRPSKRRVLELLRTWCTALW